MRVLLTTTRAWHLGQTSRAFSNRAALAGLWMADKNPGLPQGEYRRCWPYHLAMKPLYHGAPQIWDERATYAFSVLWRAWLRRRLNRPDAPSFQAAQAIMGFASEIFDAADRQGALKVIDCTNSHPTTYFGFWQRECDVWCPGEKVPIPRWFFRRITRELARADLILCPSPFVLDSMRRNGLPESKCFLSPFGVDTDRFTPRPSVPGKPRFLCVGTICLRKGHQYLFRGFEALRKEHPNAELVCVGDIKRDFRKERRRWEKTFTHHRYLEPQQINELMKDCTAFVLSSCEEGLARVIPEAMAGGLPVIVTEMSGATALVHDGVEGLIVGLRPEGIAEAMARLIVEPGLAEKMGRAARQAVEGRNWEHYAGRLLAEYERRRALPREGRQTFAEV